jgi:hypothetical protein
MLAVRQKYSYLGKYKTRLTLNYHFHLCYHVPLWERYRQQWIWICKFSV